MDFGCQNEAKLSPKWDQKSMLTSKGDFSKTRIFPSEKPRFLRSNRSKLGAKMDQKSIKKWGQQGKASWHRFLFPSRPIWAPSWPYLGTSGAILVPSWRHVRSPGANFGCILAHFGSILAHLSSPWCHLGATLAHLGPILAYLGAILAPSWPILAHLGSPWRHLGPTWRDKPVPKSALRAAM